jgi:hypothetical protein
MLWHHLPCRDVIKIPARRRCDRAGTLCTEPSDEWWSARALYRIDPSATQKAEFLECERRSCTARFLPCCCTSCSWSIKPVKFTSIPSVGDPRHSDVIPSPALANGQHPNLQLLQVTANCFRDTLRADCFRSIDDTSQFLTHHSSWRYSLPVFS